MRKMGKRIALAVILIISVCIIAAEGSREETKKQITEPVIILEETVIEKIPETRIYTLYEVPLEDDFQIWLTDHCDTAFKVKIILAMAEVESSFNPQAVGSIGELGMWQFRASATKETEKELGRRLNMFDIYDSAEAVLCRMDAYLKKYSGDMRQSLMAYNMGEAGAKILWDKGIYTSEYAEKVIEKAISYPEKKYNVIWVKEDV